MIDEQESLDKEEIWKREEAVENQGEGCSFIEGLKENKQIKKERKLGKK